MDTADGIPDSKAPKREFEIKFNIRTSDHNEYEIKRDLQSLLDLLPFRVDEFEMKEIEINSNLDFGSIFDGLLRTANKKNQQESNSTK